MALRDKSVRQLGGVGDKRAKAYEKLGIHTVEDLLRYYPRAYEDWSRTVRAAEAPAGEPCCIRGWALAAPTEHRVRQGMTLYRFRVSDGRDIITVTLFNNRFAAAKVHADDELLLFGTVIPSGRHYEMTSPLIEPASTGQRIRPLYRQTEGLTARMIENNVRQALALVNAATLPDPLPPTLLEKQQLCDLSTALHSIHFPTNELALEAARERLIFEELTVLQVGLMRLKGRSRGDNTVRIRRDHTAAFTAALPFTLTGAQNRAIADCLQDMAGDRPMSRLVQGDVGSGKTAVAAGVAYSVIREGWQAAMMAPTEILAEQHASTLSRLLGEEVRVGLLTGSLSVPKRRQIRQALEAGELDLVVGTHALLTDAVRFARLGLVITDEQHRFGVHQRACLAAKGNNPHMLVMSATPIPRTLALILYGDLDVSVLDELPPGRLPVETYAISSAKRERAYGYVRRHLDEGRQGFIVCPLVEEGEEPSDLNAATTLFEQLAAGPFAGYRLGLLHGRMKTAEKEETMAAFARGEIQLLIATTVIEVGVDVPNAVIMVVENAERFGLAQLHQLRGRVGRGKHRSTCILISDSTGEENRRRLTAMCSTNDGFKIADEDLKLRGPGDFFGDRQHGLPQLRIADLLGDMPLLNRAQMAAAHLLSVDPDLQAEENAPLRQAVEHLFDRVGEQGLN
ncbi:MAG: ATP-dependent DNA helicase RecG [Ruminococcaceae bacterium]|nr:ATP-dependent DNA helicase RecG [Oscillospiraceae bacterium]